jgi:hypothetical protein
MSTFHGSRRGGEINAGKTGITRQKKYGIELAEEARRHE